MAFKESAEEWVRKAPSQAIALIAVVGLVIGAVIGLGAGFKIEQNRTRSDVKRLKAELAAGGGGAVNLNGAIGQRLGHVASVASDSFSVTTKASGAIKVSTPSSTLYEQAVKGKLSDIVKGSRLLITVGAREVIVLAPSSKLGREVTDVSAATIAFAKGNGSKAGKIKTTDVRTVETLKTTPRTTLKVGTPVIAGGHAAGKSALNAIEIIVLPASSAFVS